MITFKCSGAQTCVDHYRGKNVSEQLAASYFRVVRHVLEATNIVPEHCYTIDKTGY
jgi:hypothetical protein